MYNIQLDNVYEFNMYSSTSTQYSVEDLFMAVMIVKEKIEHELLSFYSGGLVMTISMTKLRGADICYLIDYNKKETGIVVIRETENGKAYEFKMLYGEQNATILSKKLSEDEEKIFTSIYNAVMYMLIFHADDIINKCKEVFSKVCQTDAKVKACIKEFQKSHTEGE